MICLICKHIVSSSHHLAVGHVPYLVFKPNLKYSCLHISMAQLCAPEKHAGFFIDLRSASSMTSALMLR